MSKKMRATERQQGSGQTRPAWQGNAGSIDIYDPDGYVDAPPHAVFEQLRRDQPVYRQPMPDGTEPGSVVVLYTDGVVEARQDTELYGEERLDRLLVQARDLPAQKLAEEILADCRAFAGGELADDCAIVCLQLAR